MERKMIVIFDPAKNKHKWESLFKLDFNMRGPLLVHNCFNAGPSFPAHLSIGASDFFINGHYFVDKSQTQNYSGTLAHKLAKLLGQTNMLQVPEIFVNGTYFAGMTNGDDYILFNDFMGLQKVYLYYQNDVSIYSTSLRLLNGVMHIERDFDALREYLIMGQLFSGRSGLKGVSILAPGTLIQLRDKVLSHAFYASFAKHTENQRNPHELLEQAESSLLDSINSIYDSDVKYSMSLTGGMDSRILYLGWPDKQNLLTGTAGKGSSDYIKAAEIVKRLGRTENHALEENFSDMESYAEYYKLCDNPLLTKAHLSMKHLAWKRNRGSEIHISGVGGELCGGENLYMSRSPQMLLREAFLSYKYHPMDPRQRQRLMKAVFGASGEFAGYLSENTSQNDGIYFFLDEVVAHLDGFIGPTRYQECYTERLRTYKLACANYSYDSLNLSDFAIVMPYNDRRLINTVCSFHPQTRELRRMTMRLLKRDNLLSDIPLDTTHLPVTCPYPLQKAFRTLRMVMNIGYHKKVPLLQKGNPPLQRVNPYFDKTLPQHRMFINSKIRSCPALDNKMVDELIKDLDDVYGHSFYLQHGKVELVMRLFRISMFMEK